MNYQSNLPYPTPRVEKQNLEYARMLSQNYAGDVSEDTAVHLYIYQSIVLSEENSQIANILEKISIVEMKHLDLLGKTIKLLGLTPKFVTYSPDNIKQFWTSANVNYTTSIMSMLKQDIKAETIAIKTYEKHKNEINDKYIKELLSRIIVDEKLHLAIFEKLYEQQKKLANSKNEL